MLSKDMEENSDDKFTGVGSTLWRRQIPSGRLDRIRDIGGQV